MHFYDVIVAQVGRSLTYRSSLDIVPGSLVRVPLKKKSRKGCILRKWSDEEYKGHLPYEVRDLDGLVETGVGINPKEMILLEWISRYYHYPMGKLLFEILPKELKKPRELKENLAVKTKNEILNNDQEKIYLGLGKKIGQGFSNNLIHGVTGSGKTRIYKKIMEEVISSGQSCLFLLPEINLIPKLMDDFKESFDCPLYLYNSELSASDRYGLWIKLRYCKDPTIVIGVRSSVFLSILNLGLIIVDEEHDASFKQGDRCPYNARDVAVKKASLYNVPIILGSATPMLETYCNTRVKKRGEYFDLRKRVEGTPLPEIQLIDERMTSQGEKGKTWPLSVESISALEKALAKKEKAIVFINRLGHALFLQCGTCGHAFKCQNCSVGLKFYKKDFILRCNHCFHQEEVPQMCPRCGRVDLDHRGFGTEKVEEVLKKQFPSCRIARFDRNNIKNMSHLKKITNDFEKGDIDILVGTQMIAKGHNFKGVNTVVVLGTDALLNFPDFRASERAYQMLLQVSGRSGRYGQRGRVYVQTRDPGHGLYGMVKEGHFDAFYQQEMSLREAYGAPPFKRICLIYILSQKRQLLRAECGKIKSILVGMIGSHFKNVRVLGPRPSPVEKKANYYSWSLMMDSSDLNELHNCLNSLSDSYQLRPGVLCRIDTDPYAIG